jgi:hypothetical protein
VQIATTIFRDSVAAHNALVRLANAGTDPAQYTIRSDIVAVAFRTRFDPADGARDWAVGFSAARTLVVIKTAVNNTSADALTIARIVLSKI